MTFRDTRSRQLPKWAARPGIKNGELLRRAASRFDLLLTVDRNLEYQQSFTGLSLAVSAVDREVTAVLAGRRGERLDILRASSPGCRSSKRNRARGRNPR